MTPHELKQPGREMPMSNGVKIPKLGLLSPAIGHLHNDDSQHLPQVSWDNFEALETLFEHCPILDFVNRHIHGRADHAKWNSRDKRRIWVAWHIPGMAGRIPRLGNSSAINLSLQTAAQVLNVCLIYVSVFRSLVAVDVILRVICVAQGSTYRRGLLIHVVTSLTTYYGEHNISPKRCLSDPASFSAVH